ncbi:hypothetical protein GCM10010218_49280 [Streptomyces mashuensis]|uniref:Uncharacterized protein n=2 Tax=Streptomyces mashuensis TaxID=33904 RepID=A0A919EF42_9ACTN|nr:hypothetical protein GCM10010218_49280 [Streptomyces mashuensis]
MSVPGGDGFESAELGFDPDEVVWVRGVDYVGGWRQAKDAGAELVSALAAAGVGTDGVVFAAQSGADGSGLVRLTLPVTSVRALTELVLRAV